MSRNAENDAETYCGAEYGEVREGECECPRCVGPFPDPLQDWPMPGYLKSDDAPNLDHSAENDTGLAEHKPTVGALSGGLCCEADRDLPPGMD